MRIDERKKGRGDGGERGWFEPYTLYFSFFFFIQKKKKIKINANTEKSTFKNFFFFFNVHDARPK